ncbi:MAG: four helix bundle protein [Aridibacter famidurans]|nr:four helix bundle protein [Aridibacter famidurans]
MSSQTFKDLRVWQKAHELVLKIYKLSDSFPKHELYSLTSQLRRSAVSIPANIAEGYKKSGLADKARFMNIAQGSLEETRYYLILAQDLNYGSTTRLESDIDDVGRMLYGYTKTIRDRMRS